MKRIITALSVILGLSLISTDLEARGDGKRSGSGGNKSSSSAKSSSTSKRSPMTGSKVERPASKPTPKPASRPSAPASRPESKPQPRPVQRPVVQKPVSRPDTRPATKPDIKKPDGNRPDTRPATKPDISQPDNNRPDKMPDKRPDISRPDKKPDNKLPDRDRPDKLPDRPNKPDTKPMPRPDRPDKNKPATLPGMVTYPDRPGKDKPSRPNLPDRPDKPDRPNLADRDRPDRNNVNIDKSRGGNSVKIDNSRNRISTGDRNNIHIDKVNVNRRNNGLNRPATLPANRRDWNDNKWGGTRGVWGNTVNINRNVHIDNNFRYNNNYSYRPNYWGARPWWGANDYHSWHHGHWNYGWNSHYYHSHWYYRDNNFASGFMWGIAVWSLGNMIYDMGYHTYSNPYPAPPVQNTYITYTQPVSVAAAANPPGDEQVVAAAEAKSTEATAASRAAFKSGDYLAALKSCDEALAATPGDVTLHEYRSLIYFALGKYSEAAGILNPVLASGPGWGWDTMVDFYGSSSTYDGQLRKLEAYVKGKPDGADGHFLLGYHYMVSGHMEEAYAQFEKTAKLQPADSIAAELRNLTKSSLPDNGEDDTAEPAPPPPIPSEKLVGTWVSDRGADGKVTFKMEQNGDYIWSFINGTDSKELKGTYGLDDKGLLVLTSDDSQMVSAISLDGDSKMNFVLLGAPDGDPGLDFKKG